MMKRVILMCADKVRVGELSGDTFRCERVSLWAKGLNLDNLRSYLDGSNPSYPHPAWNVISIFEAQDQESTGAEV